LKLPANFSDTPLIDREAPVEAQRECIETITDGEETLAVLIRHDYAPAATTFLTPPEFKQQLGYIVYPAGSEIPRHDHKPVEREIRGTAECLIVKQGRSEITLYNRERQEVCRRILSVGDVVLLVAGGHGFRQIEDTVFLEIKQGPFAGVEDKVRF